MELAVKRVIRQPITIQGTRLVNDGPDYADTLGVTLRNGKEEELKLTMFF